MLPCGGGVVFWGEKRVELENRGDRHSLAGLHTEAFDVECVETGNNGVELKRNVELLGFL